MLTTSASQPAYGRTICPGKGLFVRVTSDPDTATVEDQPQNGSVTFDPDTGGTLYRVSKCVTVIVARTATDSRSCLTTNFGVSAEPYTIDGGTTTTFEAPTAIPWAPSPKPLMSCPYRRPGPRGGPSSRDYRSSRHKDYGARVEARPVRSLWTRRRMRSGA